jgi:hypothetical protein
MGTDKHGFLPSRTSQMSANRNEFPAIRAIRFNAFESVLIRAHPWFKPAAASVRRLQSISNFRFPLFQFEPRHLGCHQRTFPSRGGGKLPGG